VVEIVQFASLIVEVLDILSGICVALELVYIVFDVFGFVGDWEIKGIVSFPKLKSVNSVAHSCSFD